LNNTEDFIQKVGQFAEINAKSYIALKREFSQMYRHAVEDFLDPTQYIFQRSPSGNF
jgi:hypothetical protein